ncbi:LysR family transcriptional regulator [Pseudooceanicola sp. GBMRC 2024]|uniref:LysR family transcriptional regulator n=1 Tax=Pseudooceanicola albus TaxID=2692189 RepID=A0A6L7G307_9RHOB|nr:LysR family transcriptional regulator [Pseudooceanicola albus]MXN17806.1 LysR family transcriptional regulator [Pseudooceanicola albus]
MITRLQHSDIKLLRIFLQVVEHSGFSAAARALNISQSTISIQLKLLEQRLGFPLCRRGRKGFELTPEGRKVYEAAMALEQGMSDFVTTSAEITRDVHGALSIGISPIVCHEFALGGLPDLIGQLSRKNRNLQVRVEVCSAADLEEGIENGELDIAYMETGFLRRDLETIEIFDMYTSIYCSTEHPLAKIPDHLVDDDVLRDFKSVVFDLNTPFSNPLRHDDSEVTSSSDASIFFVMSGAYIGYLNDSLAKTWLDCGKLHRVAPARYTCNFPGGLVFRKSSLSNPLIGRAIDFVRANAGVAEDAL